jgi:hypothetical protein
VLASWAKVQAQVAAPSISAVEFEAAINNPDRETTTTIKNRSNLILNTSSITSQVHRPRHEGYAMLYEHIGEGYVEALTLLTPN